MDDIDYKHQNTISSVEDLQMDRDTMILVLSVRKTGKSILLSKIIHYFLTNKKNKCDFLYLFSHTAHLPSNTNSQYDFIDRKAIINANYINEVVEGLMHSQIKSKFKFHLLLVFDDIDLNMHQYPVLSDLAVRGRHYKITCVLSSQISNNVINPSIRSNFSYMFFRRLSKKALENNVYPSVLGFENVKELIKYTEDNIKNYQFIFYNNNTDYTKDSIKIVKATPVPNNFKYIVKYPEKEKEKKVNNTLKYWGKSIYEDKNIFKF